ncbi:Uncharacterised protein [Shigella flexneri]|nr:Uncharacterised protein [Shigella flexneri]
MYFTAVTGIRANSTCSPWAAFAINSIKLGCTSTPAMAIASDILVLNLMAADAATISGRKKKAPSPITFRMVKVGDPFVSTPLISRIIASSLTIDPPIIAGISGDMVPISASRIPAPMRRSVSLGLPTGCAGCISPGSRLTTS